MSFENFSCVQNKNIFQLFSLLPFYHFTLTELQFCIFMTLYVNTISSSFNFFSHFYFNIVSSIRNMCGNMHVCKDVSSKGAALLMSSIQSIDEMNNLSCNFFQKFSFYLLFFMQDFTSAFSFLSLSFSYRKVYYELRIMS